MTLNAEQKQFKIGSVVLRDNLFLAPLAGFSDIAFRRLCLEEGAALAVGEMASVKGLYYNYDKTSPLLKLHSSESPSCIQLFGSEVSFFERAMLLPIVLKADIIDINMGCPMPKIMKNGDGAALGADIIKAAEIVKAVKRSKKTVTAKIRLGLSQDRINAVSLASALFDSGADAITVHGRTAEQGYSGTADYEQIGNVAIKVKGKIIGNGDIGSREDAYKKIERYGLFGVAIGRAAVGNPFVFSQTRVELNNTLVLNTIFKQIAYMQEEFSERYTLINMRKHICAYLNHLKGYKKLKNEVNLAETLEKLKEVLVTALE